MNAGLIKEWCPKCATKLDVVTVRECQQATARVAVLELRCPNARCGFSVTDFDVVSTPTRPTGTAFTDKYALRYRNGHREELRAKWRDYNRHRRAKAKAEKAAQS